MICTMKELLADADKHGRAVGGFNVANMESVMGAIRAAEEMDTPIILQIAEKRMGYSPVEYIAPMMVEAARTAGVRVAASGSWKVTGNDKKDSGIWLHIRYV